MVGARGDPHPGQEAATQATILVVEDEVLVRMFIAEQLREAGYCVIEAADAREAMEVLRHHGVYVKLVFSDVQMPGFMDGLALAKTIRSEYPLIKVVLTSGHLSHVDWAAHDGFFPKPYRADKIIRHVKALLG